MTLSRMSETETTGSPEQKQEWLAEQMLRWSGLVRFENDPRIAHPSQGGPVTRGVLMSVKSVGAIVIRYYTQEECSVVCAGDADDSGPPDTCERTAAASPTPVC